MYKAIVLSLISLSVHAGINSGNYPSFAYSGFGSGRNLTNTDNIITYAIEQRHAVPLNYNGQYLGALKQVFAEAYANDSYAAKKLESTQLLVATKKAIAEFVCEEYRFRHRKPERDGCEGYVSDDRAKQPMPFISGRLAEQGLQIHQDDRDKGVSFEISLPASSDVPLSHTYGAVHELGSFFGGLADSNSLVLGLRMKAYHTTESGRREALIYPNNLIYFVILPTAKALANQANEQEAVSFATSQAKLLVVDSRK